MNNYITGAAIKALREKNRLTQQQLAEKLCVSDKAISKWETGKGFPDISLIEPLANVLQYLYHNCCPENKSSIPIAQQIF